MKLPTSFFDDSAKPEVRGWLHVPDSPNGDALILTHGAGGNCTAPLLVAIDGAFSAHGYLVLRCDLPFRQERRAGPPFPGNARMDREGLRNAVFGMRKQVSGRIFLGGHSYGGRQASMLCAEEPDLVSGVLLLSYPLHPPREPEQLRIQHLPDLRTPSLFVHGTRDPFGTIDEINKALGLIPAKIELLEIQGAGHDLGCRTKSSQSQVPERIADAFQTFFR